jgi:hypothetical protein
VGVSAERADIIDELGNMLPSRQNRHMCAQWKKRIDGVYVLYMLIEGQLSASAIALQINSPNESYRESPKPSGTSEPRLLRRSLRQASRSPLPVGSDCPLAPLRAASQRRFRSRVHRRPLRRRRFAAAVAPLPFFPS